MKWVLSLLAVFSLGVSAFAGGNYFTATPTSARFIPRAGKMAAPAFLTNSPYSLGQYALVSDGRVVMCVSTGITAAVTLMQGQGNLTNGTVTFCPVLTRPRTTLVVQNLTSTNLYIQERTATTNSGIWLAANGGSIAWNGESVPQSEFHCILSPGTTGLVYTYED